MSILSSAINWDNLAMQTKGKEVEDFLSKVSIADVIFTMNEAVLKETLFICMKKFEKIANIQLICIQLLQDCQVLTPRGITSEELGNRFDNLIKPLSLWMERVDIIINLFELLAMVADRKSMKSRCTRVDSNDLLSYIGQAIETHRKEKSIQRAGLQLYEAILSNASEKSQKVFAKMMFKAVVNNLATTNDDPKICFSSYSILCTLAEKMGDKLAPWVDRILGLLLTTVSQLFSAELVAKCIQLLEKIALTQESLYVIVAHPRCLLVFTDALGILETKHMGASITVLEYLLRVLEDESALAVVSENLNERRVLETNYFIEFRKLLHKKSKKYLIYLEEADDIEDAAVEYWKQLLEYIMNILSSLLDLEDLVDEEEEDVIEIISLPVMNNNDISLSTTTSSGYTIDVSYDATQPLEPIPEEDQEHLEDHNSEDVDEDINKNSTTNKELESNQNNTNNNKSKTQNNVRFVDTPVEIKINSEKKIPAALITWENIDEQIEGHEVEMFLLKADIADCLFTKDKVAIKKSLFICLNKFGMHPILQNRAIHLLQDFQVLTPEGITSKELVEGYEILLNTLSQWMNNNNNINNNNNNNNNVPILTGVFELYSMIADREIMKHECIRTEQNQLLSYIQQILALYQKEKSIQRAGLQLYEAILSNANEKSQKVFAKMMIKAVVNNLATTNDDPKICFSSYSILCTLAEKMGDKLAPWVDRILGLLLTTVSQLFSAELVAKCIQLLEKIALTQESLYVIVAHPRCLLVFTDALGILEVRYLPETIKVLEYLLKVLEDETAVSVIFENLKDTNQDEVNFFINFRKDFLQKSDRYVNLLQDSSTTTHGTTVVIQGKIDYILQLIELVSSILTHLLPDDILDDMMIPSQSSILPPASPNTTAENSSEEIKKDIEIQEQLFITSNMNKESEDTPCDDDDMINNTLDTTNADIVIMNNHHTNEIEDHSDTAEKDIEITEAIVNQPNEEATISSNYMMKKNDIAIQSAISANNDTTCSVIPSIVVVPVPVSMILSPVISKQQQPSTPQQQQDDDSAEEQKLTEGNSDSDNKLLSTTPTTTATNDKVEIEKIKNERNSNIKFLIQTNPIQPIDRNISMERSSSTLGDESLSSNNSQHHPDDVDDSQNEDDYMLIYARALDAKFEEDRLLAEQEAKLDNDRKLLQQKQAAAEALRLAAIQKAEVEITIAKQLVEQERIAMKAQVELEIAEAQEKAERELQELKLQTELEVIVAKDKAEKELLETKIKAENELELVKLKAQEDMILMREKASIIAAEIASSMEQAEQNRIAALYLAEKELQDMKDKAEINRIKAEKQAEAELAVAEAKAEIELALLLQETEKIALLDSMVEKEQARKLLDEEMKRMNEEKRIIRMNHQLEESSRRKFELEEHNRLLDEENSIHLAFQKEQEMSRLLFESQQEAQRIDLEEQKAAARISADHERQRIILEAEVTAARIMREQELKSIAITTEAEELAVRISIEKELRMKQEQESHETLSLLIAQQDAVRISLKETEERTILLLEEEKARRLAFEIERDKVRITMEEEHLATQTMIAALKEAAQKQQEQMLIEQEKFKAQQEIIRIEVEKATTEKEKIRVENERLLAEKKAIERQVALEKLAMITKEREAMRQQREIERIQLKDKAIAEAEERKRLRIITEENIEKERLIAKEKLDLARKLAKDKANELAIQRQIAIEKAEKQALEDRMYKQQVKQEADRIALEQSNQHIEAIKQQAKEKAASKIAMKEKDRLASLEESKRLADIAKAKINELLIEKETRIAALNEHKQGLESLFSSSHDSFMNDNDNITNNNHNNTTMNSNTSTTNTSEHDISFEVIEFETPIKSKPIQTTDQLQLHQPSTKPIVNYSNHWRIGNMMKAPVFNYFITNTAAITPIHENNNVLKNERNPQNMSVDLSQESNDEVHHLYFEALQEVQELKIENDSLKQQLHTNTSPNNSGKSIGNNLSDMLSILTQSHNYKNRKQLYIDSNINNTNNNNNNNNNNNTSNMTHGTTTTDMPKSNKIDLVKSGIIEAFTQVILTHYNNNLSNETKNDIKNKLENMLPTTNNNDNNEYIDIFANKLVLLFRKIKEDKETILCTNDNIISLRLMKLCLKLIGFIDNYHLQISDIDIIISQLGVKQLSLYGFVFTLILCAGKFLGQHIFNTSNKNINHNNNNHNNSSINNNDSTMYEDGLQGFLLFIEVIGIMVDNLLELLDTQHRNTLSQYPLGKCKLLYESEEKEIIRLLDREKKALKQIFEIYCPNQLTPNTFADSTNTINRNNILVHQISTGLTFSCIITLCHDFKLLPSLFNRNQLLTIYQLVLAKQYSTNNISTNSSIEQNYSKYIFPSILHDDNTTSSTANTNDNNTIINDSNIIISNNESYLHALDITNKLYLSFPRFLDFLVIASLRCPIFKSTDTCIMKVSNFFLLLHQSCQTNEKYLSSIKYRSKEMIAFRVNPLLATSSITSPTNRKMQSSTLKKDMNNTSYINTTTTNNNNNLANIPVTGSLFSPPSYHTLRNTDNTLTITPHNNNRGKSKGIFELKSKLSDMH